MGAGEAQGRTPGFELVLCSSQESPGLPTQIRLCSAYAITPTITPYPAFHLDRGGLQPPVRAGFIIEEVGAGEPSLTTVEEV